MLISCGNYPALGYPHPTPLGHLGGAYAGNPGHVLSSPPAPSDIPLTSLGPTSTSMPYSLFAVVAAIGHPPPLMRAFDCTCAKGMWRVVGCF